MERERNAFEAASGRSPVGWRWHANEASRSPVHRPQPRILAGRSNHPWVDRIHKMLILIVAFAVSLVTTLVAVRSGKSHAHLSHDHDLSGPQKFHAMPVPRIGGIGILAGALAGALVLWWRDAPSGEQAFLLLACGLPALVAGLAEDLTKNISPSRRLLATALSALLAVWLLDAAIRRTAIPGLDWIVSFPLGAALATVFAVAGVANSINIIDGFNGLASMCLSLIHI